MRDKLLLLVNAAISVILVGVILHVVGVEAVVNELGKLDLFYLLLSIAALFGMDLVMSYRIGILLDGADSPVKFIEILKSHFVGMLLADFTPSRTGYFATAAAMRYNYGVPAEKALLSIFGPQIFDFAFKVIVGGLAIFYLIVAFIGPEQGWVLIFGAFVIAMIIALMLLILFSRRFLRMFSFAERIPLLSRFYSVVLRMQEKSHVVVDKTPQILALILVSWTFRALSWYFAAKAVGITLELGFPEVFFYFFLQPLITMLEFVPSPTIAGLGLSEGGSTLVFSLFGVFPAKAALFALLVRFKSTVLHIVAVPETMNIPKGFKL
ncbi:flippase-like domain-containing protein [Candidatus Micrarchaeota archaeon]|nr:flippase-like domain-containing protein [Candidatus Micrarchaeota archaeon]